MMEFFTPSRSVYDQTDYGYGDFRSIGYNPRPKAQKFNPNIFTIKQWYQCGVYLVVKIQYPSAKYYEGNKVLVYEGIEIEDLKKLKCIDPHFSENKEQPTPIARFAPDDQGWVNAMKFCSMLHSERLQLDY